MQSQISLQASQLHFFEYLSIQNLEEYFRNALNYSLEILLSQNIAFVSWRYYIKEITFLIDTSIQMLFLIWKNASYAEYFYGYKRGKNQKIISLLFMIQIIGHSGVPYILQKLKQYPKFKLVNLSLLLYDFWLKTKHLLASDDKTSYSIYYKFFKVKLQKREQEQSASKLMSFFAQYGMFLVYLGLKFLDNYFTKKTPTIKIKEVSAPNEGRGIIQQLCPICKGVIKNASVLITSGYVYCYRCIYEFVNQNKMCPITKQEVSVQQVVKIYN